MIDQVSGSTLLEVLLSVMILSISISLIIQSMTASVRAINDTIQYGTALNFLENQATHLVYEKLIDGEIDPLSSPDAQKYQKRISRSTADWSDKVEESTVTISWVAGRITKNLQATTYAFKDKIKDLTDENQ